jgi:hypothetical protein
MHRSQTALPRDAVLMRTKGRPRFSRMRHLLRCGPALLCSPGWLFAQAQTALHPVLRILTQGGQIWPRIGDFGEHGTAANVFPVGYHYAGTALVKTTGRRILAQHPQGDAAKAAVNQVGCHSSHQRLPDSSALV